MTPHRPCYRVPASRSASLVVAILSAWLIVAPPADARQADYTAGVVEASMQRFIQHPDEVFESLRTIGPDELETIVVSDGAGGTRSVEVVALATLTSYLVPYENAAPLDRYTVDSRGFYRSNIWTTLAGAAAEYYLRNGLPLDGSDAVAARMLQSLGMEPSSEAMVLTFYVEPRFVTRPSFAPAIEEAIVPDWNGTSYEFTLTPSSPSTEFMGFAPTVLKNGQWQRPFTVFPGPRAYPSWLEAWSSMSYDLEADRAFPYTGLGWTWNWSDDPSLRGFAISEFLVSGDAEFWFGSLATPRQVLEGVATRLGDLDVDGTISASDLAILLGLWNEIDPSIGDLDRDGVIGPGDVAIMFQRWGPLANLL